MRSPGDAPEHVSDGPSSLIAPLSPRISSRSTCAAGWPWAAKLAKTATPAPLAVAKLDHRAVFAGEKITGTRELRRGHLQRPEQHAQRVEMMDQDFRDQHAPFTAHEGLPLQRRAEPVRSRQYARRQQRQLRLLDVADAALAQPCRRIPVIAAKAPVLMHHQARQTLDLGGEVGCLLQVGRERLLAKHRQSLLRRRAAPAARASRGALRYRWRRVRMPRASPRRRRRFAESRTRSRAARRFRRRDRRSPRRGLDLVCSPRR